MAPRQAALFIDGNNWYHGLKGLGAVDLNRLDYRRLSLKLVGTRRWIGTRYYIGRVPQSRNVKLYTDQRRFLAKLEADPLISTHLGRLEPRAVTNPTARDLRSYLSKLRTKIDFRVFQDLMKLARISHSSSRSGLMRRGWGSGRPYRTPAVVWMWATTCAWRQNRPGKHTTRERTPCPPAVVNVCRHLADRQAGSGGERKR